MDDEPTDGPDGHASLWLLRQALVHPEGREVLCDQGLLHTKEVHSKRSKQDDYTHSTLMHVLGVSDQHACLSQAAFRFGELVQLPMI